MELGDTITWRAKHFGVWQQLTVKVTEFEPPERFADEMLSGAFKRMRHLHCFQSADGGTRMIDEFEFEAPFGPLGWIAERLILRKHMTSFLLNRNAFLRERAEALCGSGAESSVPK